VVALIWTWHRQPFCFEPELESTFLIVSPVRAAISAASGSVAVPALESPDRETGSRGYLRDVLACKDFCRVSST